MVSIHSQLSNPTLSSHRQQRQHNSLAKAANSPVKLFSFRRNDQLHFHRHGLWRIHSGYVRTLSCTTEGELVPLGFWEANDVVGGAIAQISPYEAKCISTVKAEYLGSTYGFSREMVLAQVQQSNDLLRLSHCRQADLRLLQFICWLAKRFGRPGSEGQFVTIRLTHREIAESIGITRVTVSRLIKRLEREGKIKWTPYEKKVSKETFKHFCDGGYEGDRLT